MGLQLGAGAFGQHVISKVNASISRRRRLASELNTELVTVDKKIKAAIIMIDLTAIT